MLNRIKRIYLDTTIDIKIRYALIAIFVPMTILVLVLFHNIWVTNRNYEEMIESMAVASEFSLDFKKDYDYETYLLIVGAKSVEESELGALLDDASRIVSRLEQLNTTKANVKRIKSVRKYIENLGIYKSHIEENIALGNKYEDNIEIWENDVQIVTTLLRENIFQYIYYETKDLQAAKDKYHENYLKMINATLISFGIIFFILLLFSIFIPRSITKPLKDLVEVTNEVGNGNLDVRADSEVGGEVGVLSISFNSTIDKINELLATVKEEQIHLRESELELLQSQINPHFLYNTLDTIVWLAESGDEKKVVSMVKSLSDFFRASLSKGKDIVSIKEELVHARSYLEIQQVRYQDILEYEIDVPEELHHYMIPKMTIQPLVENALYHGIKNKRGLGKIKITGSREGENYYIFIEDNGKGMTAERLEEVTHSIVEKDPGEGKIYGLYNVNERIALKFGDEYGIKLSSQDGIGTKVKIILPVIS